MVSYMTNEPMDQVEGLPLYLVVAQSLEASIVDGSLPEGAQVPSTNDLALFYRINPATAAKGVAHLVADGMLHKRRGVGMFVNDGARALLLTRRRAEFATRFIDPMLREADLLGLSVQAVVRLIEGGTVAIETEGEGPAWTPSRSRV